MKLHLSLFVAALSLSTFVQPVLAATQKPEAKAAALVAALEAVSPDPLGGRLGLAVASSRSTTQTPAATNVATAQVSSAYAAWKTAKKS